MNWRAEAIAGIRVMEYVSTDQLETLTGFSRIQIGKWRKAGILSHIRGGKAVRYRLATALAEIAALQVKDAEQPKAEGGAG